MLLIACSSILHGWTIKKELDPIAFLGVLATVGIGVLIFILGKRLTTRRFEREHIITLLKDIYPSAKAVHVLFYQYSRTRAPITAAMDSDLRAQLTQLKDQVLLVTEAIMLMKKHCETISSNDLTVSYRRFKGVTTANTLGHTLTFDLTRQDIQAESLAYHALMQVVHSFIFELNVV
jgi:hypothetical protein